MTLPTIKLMADFSCWPLWSENPPNNIDPQNLPLSNEIVELLDQWSEMFESDFDWTSSASCEWDPQRLEDFDQLGISIWKQLRQELQGRFHVVYFSSRLARVVHDPADLP